MNEETKAILERVDALASKLGTTAEHLIGEVQGLGEIYLWMGTGAILICACLVALGVWLERRDDYSEGGITAIVSGVMGLILGVCVVCCEAVPRLVAPGLWLAEKVLR